MKSTGIVTRSITLRVVLLAALSLVLAGRAQAQSTSFTTATIDGVLVDIDQSGTPTCGDGIDFTVTVQAAPTGNALNTELVLPIDAKTTLDPTSVVVSAPNGNPQVVRADSVLDVVLGTVCGPAPCSAATVRFRTYISLSAIGPDVFEQGSLSASNAATVQTSSFFQPFNSCGGNPQRPDLALTKSDGGLTADPGQTIPYTLTARNQGTATAFSSLLSETVPAATTFNAGASSPGWSCSGAAAGSSCTLAIGDLAPGIAVTRVFAVTAALPFPTGRSSVTNTATVQTATQESDLTNNSATDTTLVRPGNPDLRLTKSLSSGAAAPGSTLVYSLSLTNLGNATAVSARFSETIPANTTFVAGFSTGGWVCSPGNGAGSSCTLAAGDLLPGQAATAAFAVRVSDPLPAGVTAVGNTACAATSTSGDPAGNDCSTVTTPTQGTPALSLDKALAQGDGTPGSTLVFTLSVTNNGNQGAAGVVLRETVPANTTFSPAGSSPGWSCSAPSAGSTCSLSVGTLAGGGGSASRSFAVVIDNPLPAGVTQVANTACSSAANLQSCDSVTVPTNGSPSLHLEKTLSSGTGAPGSVLVYSLTATNSGNQAATGLSLSETVPAHTRFEAASSTAGWTCVPGTGPGSACSHPLANLPGGGGAVSVLFAVRIDNPLPAGATRIANTACLASGSATADCDDETTPTTGQPVLGVSKALTAGTPAPGNTLVYTLTVTNSGNQDATGVSLADQLPPGTTFVPTQSSAGWSCSPSNTAPATCTISIGALAAQASASRTIALRLADPWPAGSIVLTNQGCATADGGQVACTSVDTPVEAAPQLSLVKSYSGPPLSPGAHLVFDLAVQNTGNQVAAAVTVQETVPVNTSFDAAASSPEWSCTAPAAASTCSLTLTSLAPGTTVHLAFAVVAAAPLPPGVTQVTNSACASVGPPAVPRAVSLAPGDTSCSQAATPLAVFLAATLDDSLAEDSNHDGYPETGDVLRYTLIVRNPSTGTAHGVRVSIPALDVHLEIVPGSITTTDGTVAEPAGPADPIVSLPDLHPGASVTITFEARVAGALPPALRFLSSQGTVTGTNLSAVPTDDPDTPEPGDPTLTPLRPQAPPVHVVPTLSGVGLVALALVLAGASLVLLRRRSHSRPAANATR